MKTWLRKILGIERRERDKRIIDAFSRYVDSEKLEQLVKEMEENETGENRESEIDGTKRSW